MSILTSKMVFSVYLNFHNIIYTPDNLQISHESLSNLCVWFIEPLAIYCFERRHHFLGGGRKYKHIMKMTQFPLFSNWKKTNFCSSYVSLKVTKDAILLLWRKRTAMSAVTFDTFLLKYFALHFFI